jgi:endonuclease/exonuclease/phosphatase family metal-dependent hydrolase
MPVTICTFNANNLYVRYRFGSTFPGDRSGRSMVENPNFGYLPVYDPDLLEIFNPVQRTLSARALTQDGTILPDVICLQEIESLIALRHFNEDFLGSSYPYAFLVDSRDFRQIDVGILSRREILDVRSNVDEPDTLPGGGFLFSRDCLEVEVGVGGNRRLSLFINHFKSKYAETPEDREEGDAKRLRQAEKVASLLKSRFPGSRFNQAWFAVLGDLNDEPSSAPLAPLMQGLGLTNALEAVPNETDRWTHWWRSENEVSQLDYVLISPALAEATAGAAPVIERRGLGFSRILVDGSSGPRETRFTRGENDPNPARVNFQFPRFEGVTPTDYASDHCPVFLTIP